MIVGVSLIQEIYKIDDISLTKFHLARKSDMTGIHDWYLHTKYPICTGNIAGNFMCLFQVST